LHWKTCYKCYIRCKVFPLWDPLYKNLRESTTLPRLIFLFEKKWTTLCIIYKIKRYFLFLQNFLSYVYTYIYYIHSYLLQLINIFFNFSTTIFFNFSTLNLKQSNITYRLSINALTVHKLRITNNLFSTMVLCESQSLFSYLLFSCHNRAIVCLPMKCTVITHNILENKETSLEITYSILSISRSTIDSWWIFARQMFPTKLSHRDDYISRNVDSLEKM